MGFFGQTKEPEKKQSSGGGTLLTVIVVLMAMVSAPLIVIFFAIFAIAGERRRVRLSRWAIAAGATFAVSLVAAGLSLSRWLSWWASAPAALWGGWVPVEWTVPILNDLRLTNMTSHTLGLWAQHAAVSVPVSLALMTVWWWWRSYALRVRGENEGSAYSNMRPVGWMDRLRARLNEQAVRSGKWSEKNPGEVVIGIGTYGEVAATDMDAFKKAAAAFGTSRSGKTRMANSIAAQQVVELGCGNITLDWKGGDDVAQAKADLAQRMGVPFLHFKLMSRTGGGYTPPHPYAPARPAHYDPLQRGNGASKAAMLLNSVPREGDAAVYGRKASEAVKLAYDIAALTGFDRMKTEDGHPISGLAVLAKMLDTKILVQQGKSVTIKQVRRAHPFLSEAAAQAKVSAIHSRIRAFEAELGNSRSTLSGALEDVRSTVASYVNDSAAGPFLTPGSIPTLRIDLVRAILRNEIIVFSLPAQEYPEMSAMIGTMVLLDLQNAVATLRDKRAVLEAGIEAGVNEVRPGGADATPWNPLVVQLEELGSVSSPAAAEAMLGLFNKSADVGIRPILSSQSLADIEAVDGTGVWLRQLTGQIDNMISFQLSESHDAEKVAAFSGTVDKKIPTEQKDVDNNRTGLFTGADAAAKIIGRPEERTRVDLGAAQELDRSRGELLWITKAPKLTAVHTTGPEGPNNWSETLTIAPVHEREKDWDPFADSEQAQEWSDRRDEVFGELLRDLRHNPLLHQVLDDSREAVEVEQSVDSAVPATAVQPVAAGVGEGDAEAALASAPEEQGPDDVFPEDTLATEEERDLFGDDPAGADGADALFGEGFSSQDDDDPFGS